MQPYPRSPDLVWPGHLHATSCLSARAVGTGFPTVVRRLCLGPVCGWMWVLLTPPVLGSWVGAFGHGLWCCPSSVGCLWCSWLGFGFGLLMGRVWFRACPACPPSFPVSACGVGVRAGPGSRLCPALRGWVVGVCFLRFFFFAGCPCPGPCGPCPPIPFLSGWAAGSFFFSWCVSACFGVPFPGGPLFLAWCCQFRLGGPPVPPRGPCLRCLLGGGLAASGGVGGRFGGCGLFSPPPPLAFFWVGGIACSSLCLPWLAHALARIQCCLPGCCWRLRSVWPCSGPVGRVHYVHGELSAPSCRVRSWLCRPGGCPGGCLWLWVRGLGLFVSFPLCGAGFNLLGGPPPLLPGALWPRLWPAVLVCGVLVRRLPGCAVVCFG